MVRCYLAGVCGGGTTIHVAVKLRKRFKATQPEEISLIFSRCFTPAGYSIRIVAMTGGMITKKITGLKKAAEKSVSYCLTTSLIIG